MQGQKADERDEQPGSVDLARPVILHKRPLLGVVALAAHLVVDRVARPTPPVDRPREAQALDELDRPIEGDPRHHLRVHEFPGRPALLPDPRVGLAPGAFEELDELPVQRPAEVMVAQAHASAQKDHVRELPEDVELQLIVGPVADPYGARAVKPREPWQLHLGQTAIAEHRVHGPHLIGLARDDAEQPVAPARGLVVVAGVHHRRRRARQSTPASRSAESTASRSRRRARRGPLSRGRR